RRRAGRRGQGRGRDRKESRVMDGYEMPPAVRAAMDLASASSPAITLDPSQEAAVDLMLEARVAIVTGGPGCGKTTTLRTALDKIDARQPPRTDADDISEPRPAYLLASPTGKAARRMKEATGREAMTLHRLLEYSPREGGF